MKKESKMSKVFIKNIGKLVSGDLEKGALNANTVYIAVTSGKIKS